ncbi:MAG: tetratricopeptide repeat protein [Candidatus Omnitrophica bacterium]|nr:tetratricopeptide repeat protein [Candidatus Omnitrophota bacterium]
MISAGAFKKYLPFFAIAVLGFAIYANSLSGKFVWDDDILIKDNMYLRQWSKVPEIFTTDWGKGSDSSYFFYRPIVIFTYLVNYKIGKLNVVGYHLFNVIFHIVAAFLVYKILVLLFNSKPLAFLTAMFFVAHPIQTETVCYISNRGDIMVLICMLAGFYSYVRFSNEKRLRFYALTIVCCALALLTKENGIILPLILLLYNYSFARKIKAVLFLPIILIPLAYIALRLFVLKSVPLNVASMSSAVARVPGVFAAIAGYTRILFFPFNLHMEYGNSLFALSDKSVIAGLAISSLLLITAFARRKRDRVLLFSAIWFFVTLLPVSNIYPLAFYMAEHYMYVPSIGFFLILSSVITQLYARRNFKMPVASFAVVLILFYSALTVRQNNYWHDPVNFYERTLRLYPYSARAYHNLAILYKNHGKTDKAIDCYKKAISVQPDYSPPYNNLGLLYGELGERAKAIAYLQKAIKLKKNCVNAYNSLASVYAADNMYGKALEHLNKAKKINPSAACTYINLGYVYNKMGKTDEAVKYFRKAVSLNADRKDAYFNLGNAYSKLGMRDEAIKSYKKALSIDPDYAAAHLNLGTEYASGAEKAEAIEAFKKVLEIEPDNPSANNNLAVLYYYAGRLGLARKFTKRAIALGCDVHPDFLNLINNK